MATLRPASKSVTDVSVLDTPSAANALLHKSHAHDRDDHNQISFPWDKKYDDGLDFNNLPAQVDRFIKPMQRSCCSLFNKGPLGFLMYILPCMQWIRAYNWKVDFPADLIAGLSVGCMVVPQGMSYANLAGLPSVYGLYGAFLPCIAYGLLGTSKQLAVGPVAVTSLLIGSGLKDIIPQAADIANPNNVAAELKHVQDEYNHLAIQLSFLVACLYTAVGLLRLGFLTNFLSHSVISGFTSGAAVIIGLSQVKYILGFKVPRKDRVHEQLKDYFDGMDAFQWREWVMGCCLIILLNSMKMLSSKYKKLSWLRPIGPMTVCLIGIVAVYAGHIEDDGVKIIETIPAGLPHVTIGWWFPMGKIGELIGLAVIVMVVDLLESMSIAKALARKNGYELVPNQEIAGLGVANFAGSMFNAYTTTGSFSRSAVNNDVGARSPMAQFVCGLLVMMVLLFLTPLFEKLPYTCLAAIIISGCTSIFDLSHASYFFKVSKKDFLVWLASFMCTMFMGVEIGLAIAIGLAVATVVYESAFPHTAQLGRIPGTSVYRNIQQYPNAECPPGMILYRIDAPLYFANVNFIRDQLRHLILHRNRSAAEQHVAPSLPTTSEISSSDVDTPTTSSIVSPPGPIKFVILEMSPVSHIDATGLHALHEVWSELKNQGVQLALANPSARVVRSLELDGLPAKLGRDWIFVTISDAVQFCKSYSLQAQQDSAERGSSE